MEEKVTGHQTALHQAAMTGNSHAVAALIQGGCALDLQDKDGNTALHEVSWHGFTECVKLLVKAEADVNIQNKAGNTALHLASQNAHAQSTRLLLLRGSTPDTKNIAGDTSLHVAARYNNVTIMKILLGSLCSVTARNQRGDTALHVAAALNHKKSVQLLLKAGTDGTIRNNAGKTALDQARDNNHKDMALLLARAPQVHRFIRGRTIVKKREGLTAGRRSNSDTRMEMEPTQDGSSLVVKNHSNDQVETREHKIVSSTQRQQLDLHKTPATPGSPYTHRRRKVKQKAVQMKKELLWADKYDDISPLNGNTYQLYTLYRDKDGNIRQAPAKGCPCKPMISKLDGQLKATQEEMRLHILNMQQQVDIRLDRIDRRNRHQVKMLDMINQERAAAQRKNMMYMIQQAVAQGREEAMITQAALNRDLKRWCMAHIHIPAKGQYHTLFPSSSVEHSVDDSDQESHPLLSMVSGESGTSLATYVNILPSTSHQSLPELKQEPSRSRSYFEMKVDRSPDDYENTALLSLSSQRSNAPCWQNNATAALVPLSGGGFSSSSSHSSLSDQGALRSQNVGELMANRQTRKDANHSRTLEFFIDRPAEPSFSQERNNLHAMEVTQRFFECVSLQLERWYERKVSEVEEKTALRVEQDREGLLQQIGMLEEEIEKLRVTKNKEN